MPIVNIVDERTNKHNVVCSVIFEDAWHDNHIPGATKFPQSDEGIMYLGIRETDIKSAIAYINQEYPLVDITMFLSDSGTNYYDYLTIFQDDDGKYYLIEKTSSELQQTDKDGNSS